MARRLSAVNFHVTNRCSLECAHCLYDSGRSVLPEQDTSTALRWIDQFGRACEGDGTVNLFGGEPLLRADIFDLIRHCYMTGLHVGITTSAAVGRGRFRRLLESPVDRITMDLHGASPATHDRIRRLPHHFERTVAALSEIVVTGHKACVNVPLARYNLPEIAEILDIALSVGAYAVSFYLMSPAGRGTDLRDEVLGPDEWLAARAAVSRWLGEAGPRAPLTIWERSYEARALLGGLRKSMCRDAFADTVDVRCDGAVFACGLLMSVDGLVTGELAFALGSLATQSLDSILDERRAHVVVGDETGCPALACHANAAGVQGRSTAWNALDPRPETDMVAKICPYDWQSLNGSAARAKENFAHVGLHS